MYCMVIVCAKACGMVEVDIFDIWQSDTEHVWEENA